MDTTEKAAATLAGRDGASVVITEQEAARRLKLSRRTLQRMRLAGGGPRFVCLTGNRIAYREAAIEAWLLEREVASTSEATARQADKAA